VCFGTGCGDSTCCQRAPPQRATSTRARGLPACMLPIPQTASGPAAAMLVSREPGGSPCAASRQVCPSECRIEAPPGLAGSPRTHRSSLAATVIESMLRSSAMVWMLVGARQSGSASAAVAVAVAVASTPAIPPGGRACAVAGTSSPTSTSAARIMRGWRPVIARSPQCNSPLCCVLSCRWELAPSSRGGTQLVARWTAEPSAVDAAPASRTDGQPGPGVRADGQAA